MNQSATTTLRHYRRLYQKMHDTILFARIIPTVVLSSACILLLFLALLFGLNLPLFLDYLANSCLIALCALASCFFFLEKVLIHPPDNPKRGLLYCLLSETLLPIVALILASIFLYWPLIFLSLFPLAFGISLCLGHCERKIRLGLVWLQGILLCFSLFLTILYIDKTIGHFTADISYVIALLICLALYSFYNLRYMVLLCDDSLFHADEEENEEEFYPVTEEEREEEITAEDDPEALPEETFEDDFEKIWADIQEENPEYEGAEATENTTEETPEEVPEEVSEETPEDATEEISEETSEEIPEDFTEETSEENPEEVPEDSPEDDPEEIPEEAFEESAEESPEEEETSPVNGETDETRESVDTDDLSDGTETEEE